MNSKNVVTDAPVLDVLAKRWSTRAYDASAQIDESKLASALEAARWSASAYNIQPWRFIVAYKGTSEFEKIADSLVEFNQAWANNASVLIVNVAVINDGNGNDFSHAIYDLGQAVANFTVQAHSDGLHVHQMSGFDPESVAQSFKLADNLKAVTVMAVGNHSPEADVPDFIQEGETQPRTRIAVSDLLIK